MGGFLDRFRSNVITSVWKERPDEPLIKDIDDRIALGVLLWIVAEADSRFLPEEEAKIKEILLSHSNIPYEEIPLVLTSIRAAAKERIDLYTFTHEVSQNLPYSIRLSIVKDLFRVACADEALDDSELEVIRKISGLFHISHNDFIDAKIKIKQEFGLDTAGP